MYGATYLFEAELDVVISWQVEPKRVIVLPIMCNWQFWLKRLYCTLWLTGLKMIVLKNGMDVLFNGTMLLLNTVRQ